MIGEWAHPRQFTTEWVKAIPYHVGRGVYVISYAASPLYVGRGNIRERLLKHVSGEGNRYVAMAVKNRNYLTFTYMELFSEHQAETALIDALGGRIIPGLGPLNLANLMRGSDPEDGF